MKRESRGEGCAVRGPASVNTGDRRSPGWVRGLYLRPERGRYVLRGRWEMSRSQRPRPSGAKFRSLESILNGELAKGFKQRSKVISGFTRMVLAVSDKTQDQRGVSGGSCQFPIGR